jgi:hypothetical protein
MIENFNAYTIISAPDFDKTYNFSLFLKVKYVSITLCASLKLNCFLGEYIILKYYISSQL